MEEVKGILAGDGDGEEEGCLDDDVFVCTVTMEDGRGRRTMLIQHGLRLLVGPVINGLWCFFGIDFSPFLCFQSSS